MTANDARDDARRARIEAVAGVLWGHVHEGPWSSVGVLVRIRLVQEQLEGGGSDD